MTALFLSVYYNTIIQKMAEIQAHRDLWSVILGLTIWWAAVYAAVFIGIGMGGGYREIHKLRYAAEAIIIGGFVCVMMILVAMGIWTYWLDYDININSLYFG